MAGQPDWQRFASATGPVLYQNSPTADGSSAIMYIGPWRSLFLNANTKGVSGGFAITMNFYSDNTGATLVRAQKSTIDQNKTRIGWTTVYSPFVKFSWQGLSYTQYSLTFNIYPNMLDAVVGVRATAIPYIPATTATVSSTTGVSFATAAYSMPGPAHVSLYSTAPGMLVQALNFNGDGTMTTFDAWQLDEPYKSATFATNMPDAPVQLWATNTRSAVNAQITASVTPG